MSNNPLVSIVIPTYNREDFIEEAVDSVISQTYKNWELFIVDDGSTDNTEGVVKKYLTDSRVSYHKKENGGQSSGRNFGYKISSGEFIAFLDSDNYWHAERLEKSVNAANDNPDCGVIYADNITVDEQGNEMHRDIMRRYSGDITAKLMYDNFVTINTSMIKRECIEVMGLLDESFRRAPDYEFWLRLSTKYKFYYLPEFVAYYREFPGQISADKYGRFEANRNILEHFFKAYPDAVSLSEKRRGISALLTRKARYEFSQNNSWQGVSDLGKAFWQFPFWQGPWRASLKMLLLRY